jgi:hypothetical protein
LVVGGGVIVGPVVDIGAEVGLVEGEELGEDDCIGVGVEFDSGVVAGVGLGEGED